jgi:hypothetical protein
MGHGRRLTHACPPGTRSDGQADQSRYLLLVMDGIWVHPVRGLRLALMVHRVRVHLVVVMLGRLILVMDRVGLHAVRLRLILVMDWVGLHAVRLRLILVMDGIWLNC